MIAKLPSDPIFQVSETYPQTFIDHYVGARFDKQDFTIKQIEDGNLTPMDWWDCQQKGQITSAEKQVIQVAREDYGIENGLSIPTMSQPEGIAGVSIISEETDQAFRQLQTENGVQLNICTKLFHDCVFNIPEYKSQFLIPAIANLTETEKKVLRYLVSGLPMKAVQDGTGVPYKYATKVLGEVREKFGKITKDKLVYALGLLNILEAL